MYAYPSGVDLNGLPVPFAQIIGRDHYAATVARIEDSSGNVLKFRFGIESGDVQVNRTAAVRRSCQMIVTPYEAGGPIDDPAILEQLAASLVPKQPSDTFAPYGNILRPWRGIRVPGATYSDSFDTDIYYWPLGVFRLASASITDDGVPKLSITAYDHSRTIARNKITQPWIVAAGTNYGDAITALCQDRLPGLQALPHGVIDLTPQIIVDPETDPWKTVTDWAAAIGYEVYIDVYGQLVIQAEPDPSTDPVTWTYQDGTLDANAVLLSVDRSMNDEPGYNGVVLMSESTTIPVPIRVEVWDNNPSSPTYYLGPYGKVPKFVSNPLVTTTTQGTAAATAELLKSAGGTEQASFAIVPNPAHEAGDVVRVVRPLSRTDRVGVIDSMTIPLDVKSAMSIQTRERRSLE
jgi:hypothetical protein